MMKHYNDLINLINSSTSLITLIEKSISVNHTKSLIPIIVIYDLFIAILSAFLTYLF